MADMPLAQHEPAQREMAARLAAFTAELRAVTSALDPEDGWYAAFARRSAEELGAWLAGRELPPWDVVADLLQDLAGSRGPAVAEQAGLRLRAGYEAAARAQDALPGSRESLTRRLGELDRTERACRLRERQLAAALDAARQAGQPGEADRLGTLRLWAQDDEERLLSRRAELRARLAQLGQRATAPPASGTAQAGEPAAREAAAREAAPPKARKPARKPRGARFAGLEEEAAPSAAPPAVPLPEPAAPEATPMPSGSRFAGALREAPAKAGRKRRATPTEEDREVARQTARQLRQLRSEGQSGAAHILLCATAGGPPVQLPVVLAELERTGLASDMAMLLWEAASLPPGPLAAAAEALAAAGRERDCGQLLRQGAARPAREAGTIAAELHAAGHVSEAVTLLAALVQARTAEEAAAAATSAPDVVVPLLLDAARQVSPRHHYAVTSELRRAGVA
ncbi:hypothetical protein [Streptomyces litchfieldiae]|uniref:UL36 very large tegument protein n=1 Tax=Streptomyces litchfieldiae TaxID=3075543 RepID=A0ABU2MR59_9ACTN|nr:hypothetical protein [Streptomyces sp. DSM 44938]MDT0344020.1 hypothetical protein [Streptomyces sp. DSM 44938]